MIENYVKLTGDFNREIWLNMASVFFIEEVDTDGSSVVFSDGRRLYIREKPEEVMAVWRTNMSATRSSMSS